VHELALVQEIVAIVSDRVSSGQVMRLVLHIGKLAAVSPDAVRFCFTVCAEGTRLEGAALDIVEVPGIARCRGCGARIELLRPFGICACGRSDLEWLSGEELVIKHVEVQ
jgi:hydrogenase nickel incorporation protein HypA/HybF